MKLRSLFHLLKYLLSLGCLAFGVGSHADPHLDPIQAEFRDLCVQSQGAETQPGLPALEPELGRTVHALRQLVSSVADCAEAAKALSVARSVVLRGAQLNNLRPLSILRSVEELDLSANAIVDISPLSSLVTLRTVLLTDNKISDVGPLGDLENLQVLRLDRNSLEHLAGVSSLTQLAALSASENRIQNLGALLPVASLQSLDLKSNLLTDVDALRQLKNLKVLNISGNRLANLESLGGLAFLERLSAQNNRISDLGWQVEKPLRLRELYLNFNGLTKTADLAELPELEVLELRGNRVRSWSELARFAEHRALRRLDLRENPLLGEPRCPLQPASICVLDAPHSDRIFACDMRQGDDRCMPQAAHAREACFLPVQFADASPQGANATCQLAVFEARPEGPLLLGQRDGVELSEARQEPVCVSLARSVPSARWLGFVECVRR